MKESGFGGLFDRLSEELREEADKVERLVGNQSFQGMRRFEFSAHCERVVKPVFEVAAESAKRSGVELWVNFEGKDEALLALAGFRGARAGGGRFRLSHDVRAHYVGFHATDLYGREVRFSKDFGTRPSGLTAAAVEEALGEWLRALVF